MVGLSRQNKAQEMATATTPLLPLPFFPPLINTNPNSLTPLHYSSGFPFLHLPSLLAQISEGNGSVLDIIPKSWWRLLQLPLPLLPFLSSIWMRSGNCRRKKDPGVVLRPLLWWRIRPIGGVVLRESVLDWWRNRGPDFTSWGAVLPCSFAGATTAILEVIRRGKAPSPRFSSFLSSRTLLSFLGELGWAFLAVRWGRGRC